MYICVQLLVVNSVKLFNTISYSGYRVLTKLQSGEEGLDLRLHTHVYILSMIINHALDTAFRLSLCLYITPA